MNPEASGGIRRVCTWNTAISQYQRFIDKDAEQEIRKECLRKATEMRKLGQAKERFKDKLSALLVMKDTYKRGKLFEDILTDSLIHSAFLLSITGDDNEGIVEQIDGVIEMDGEFYPCSD
ncbi:hypothetical protein GCM10008014_30460 [Paenibacillus silvae]|uniref:Uncharacterized protein n=1 Tax=Paenibacillus silvae TaxID=1325358 RepID=A0ABQ1ZCH9_9BACL|nr:hypothetical protein [Paenibacillus silvae]GGH58138.1 hypothetical protein GCM10008014_30460 [Paenibacillus silvae]